MIEEKRSRGKQYKKMLNGLTIGQVTEALSVMKYRDAWKVMITYAKKQGT